MAYSFIITNNGREVENLSAGKYATEAEAVEAGEAACDDLCPRQSPMRKFYEVEAIELQVCTVIQYARNGRFTVVPGNLRGEREFCGHRIRVEAVVDGAASAHDMADKLNRLADIQGHEEVPQ